MSSRTYSACLIPDPRLRRLVFQSAALFASIGILLIWQFHRPTWLLLLATGVWLALFVWQLRRLRKGWRDCTAIRVMPGAVFEVRNRSCEWVPAELKAGSVVFDHVAWLRLKTDAGLELAELFLPPRRRCNNWRRLQVIWRHIGAT